MVSLIGVFCKRDLLFYQSYQPKPPHTNKSLARTHTHAATHAHIQNTHTIWGKNHLIKNKFALYFAYVCLSVYESVSVCVCTYIHTRCTFVCVHVCVCVFMCVFSCDYFHVCTCTFVHVCLCFSVFIVGGHRLCSFCLLATFSINARAHTHHGTPAKHKCIIHMHIPQLPVTPGAPGAPLKPL